MQEHLSIKNAYVPDLCLSTKQLREVVLKNGLFSGILCMLSYRRGEKLHASPVDVATHRNTFARTKRRR